MRAPFLDHLSTAGAAQTETRHRAGHMSANGFVMLHYLLQDDVEEEEEDDDDDEDEGEDEDDDDDEDGDEEEEETWQV
jgi:hypothetical protein